VLEDDGEDDDACGGDQGPGEEDDLAQAFAARRGGRGAAVQRGIFFFGAAGRVFGCARGLLDEERCPLRRRRLMWFPRLVNRPIYIKRAALTIVLVKCAQQHQSDQSLFLKNTRCRLTEVKVHVTSETGRCSV
jgi:hypothetical protein